MVKGLQKCQRSNLEVDKNLPIQSDLTLCAWPLTFLQPLDLQGCIVPHLKDLICICVELEAQGYGMTFNRFYAGSKYPYLTLYRGKWLYLFCRGCSYLVWLKFKDLLGTLCLQKTILFTPELKIFHKVLTSKIIKLMFLQKCQWHQLSFAA